MVRTFKLSLIILLSIVFSTCTPRHKGTNVDESLYKIYLEFIDDCERHGIDLKDYPTLNNLKQKSLSEETVGICITDEFLLMKYRNIFISDRVEDEFLLKFIVYHEMGHCVFNLGHDESEDIRIMTKEINLLNRDLYFKNWRKLRMVYFDKIHNISDSVSLQGTYNCTIKYH
jgi:hypothetical protein